MVKYTYDVWGKVEKVTDANGTDLSSNSKHIANVNPIRYRSYYYDTETQLYYLQSRYYDSETRRFINADDAEILKIGNGILKNLFIYSKNNPVNFVDYLGYSALSITIGFISYILTHALWMVAGPKIKLALNIINIVINMLAFTIGFINYNKDKKALDKKYKKKKINKSKYDYELNLLNISIWLTGIAALMNTILSFFDIWKRKRVQTDLMIAITTTLGVVVGLGLGSVAWAIDIATSVSAFKVIKR